MPVELDDNLRRELVDLLADVPALRERSGRDAWLKRNLPQSVQDQIGHREDNARRDLTFIISAVQKLQLQDGRWVILILLDDLLKELEDITLGNDIKEVRKKIAETLESPRREPRLSPELLQPELPPPGDPRRQEWLRKLGFKRDPFLYTDGGTDPFLQEYFYFGMRHFYHIQGDVSRPGTVFVFGPPGSGKSSLRNVIAQLCRKDGILPVVYHNFGPLVSRCEKGEGVQVADHVAQMLKTAIRTLAEELEKESTPLQKTEPATIVRNQLWLVTIQPGVGIY